jgi:hypothetical protein
VVTSDGHSDVKTVIPRGIHSASEPRYKEPRRKIDQHFVPDHNLFEEHGQKTRTEFRNRFDSDVQNQHSHHNATIGCFREPIPTLAVDHFSDHFVREGGE